MVLTVDHPTSLHVASRFKSLWLMIGVWICLVLAGVASLDKYASTPGVAAAENQFWPTSVLVSRPGDVVTLVMTIHPQCACSRASISELEGLMTRCRGHLKALVLFVELPVSTHDSARSDLWHAASQIDGVTCVQDHDGLMSARFGARTSGQVFVYDPHGQLRFAGGITSARGHAGENDGVNAVQAIVAGNAAAFSSTPVFGCSLR